VARRDRRLRPRSCSKSRRYLWRRHLTRETFGTTKAPGFGTCLPADVRSRRAGAFPSDSAPLPLSLSEWPDQDDVAEFRALPPAVVDFLYLRVVEEAGNCAQGT
jgi:hypothetical protein